MAALHRQIRSLTRTRSSHPRGPWQLCRGFGDHLPTAYVMAYLQSRLNTPAILRALADVAEQFPHLSADFSARADFDLLRMMDANKPSVAVQFSCDFLAMDHKFRTALGKAYRKYGGDPSAFLAGPELIEATNVNA